MPDDVNDAPNQDELTPADEPSLQEGSTPERAPEAPPPSPPALDIEALRAALGGGYGVMAGLGRSAAEVVPVGIESVVGQSARITGYTAGLTDFDAINAEFAAVDHLGFELRIALNETEAMLAGLLVPLESAAVLFGVDTSPEQMDDAAFATAQAGPISERLREFLDLANLTLFADGLAGAEVTVSELRRGQVEWTMGMVQDVAQGAAPARIDAIVALASGAMARVTFVVPVSLLARMAEELAAPAVVPASAAGETPERASTGAAAAAALFRGAADNVTPFPAAPSPFEGGSTASAGVGPGADTPVHPVRFPPLPAFEAGGGPPRPIDILMDVSMRVSVELGRSSMTVEEILELGPGSVVELNKLAGEPVDILVNDRLIARGEVVVVDENFGVRITEIISPRQRANAIGR